MQFTSFLTLASIALAAVCGVQAEENKRDSTPHPTTIWVPTATVVETNTFTGTRVEQIWTTVAPYEWETTFPITWTATQTKTQCLDQTARSFTIL
ncbi:hypothetical protein VTO73DRAFT_8286 [Trametes versicolor]